MLRHGRRQPGNCGGGANRGPAGVVLRDPGTTVRQNRSVTDNGNELWGKGGLSGGITVNRRG